MSVAALPHPRIHPADRAARWEALVLLQAFVIAVMLIPSDTVFSPIGAAGYPASLIGLAVWLVQSHVGIGVDPHAADAFPTVDKDDLLIVR